MPPSRSRGAFASLLVLVSGIYTGRLQPNLQCTKLSCHALEYGNFMVVEEPAPECFTAIVNENLILLTLARKDRG